MKKTLLSVVLFVLMLVLAGPNAWADNSRIAVVAQGNTPEAEVSPVAARGPYFLIFDGKDVFIEALANPHQNAGGSASTLVVDELSGKGVTKIIAGDFGNKMITALKARRISYLKFKGTAVDAVKQAVQ
ncbi:MAG: NifB/NifX family molybdenum-iron cluster-binding protein [Smithellaceae bacterium]